MNLEGGLENTRPALEYAHPPIVSVTLGVALSRPQPVVPRDLKGYQQVLGPEWIGDWSAVPADQPHFSRRRHEEPDGQQLTNVLSDRVIRISERTFSFTWLGTQYGLYPRYENVRDGFVAAWDLWTRLSPQFATDATSWTVSYLNRMPQGTVWQSSSDWNFCRLFPGQVTGLSEKVTQAHWALQLSEFDEPLQVDWAWAPQLEPTTVPVIWVQLAIGSHAGRHLADLLAGMDAGRRAIVQTFREVMSPAANAYWGLRRREK